MKIKKTKASVLVVSLIVMSIVLLASMSIAFVATQERRASIGASKTGVVFQSADQVVEQTMKEIQWGNHKYVEGISLPNFICFEKSLKYGDYKVEFFKQEVDEATGVVSFPVIDCKANENISIGDIYKFKVTSISSQIGRAIEAKVDCNIRNCDQLKRIGDTTLNLDEGYYCLANEILDCGDSMTPISSFSGVLDGNGFAIKNFKIDSSDENVGLFSVLSNATVQNLGVEGAEIISSGGSSSAGVLAGKTEGTVNISSCYADTDESVTPNKDSSVKGKGNVGGLVGETLDGTTISQSYSKAKVEATEDGASIGGLVGSNGGKIENSYAVGDVTGKISGNTGGLIGENDQNDNAIKDSYYGGTVSVGSNLGGLIGNNSGADDCISDSYYISTNNPTVACGTILTPSCTSPTSSKSEAEMIDEDTYITANWNFYDKDTSVDGFWQINNGSTYPCFKWQGGPDICPKPDGL